MYVEEIPFNEKLWESCVRKLEDFYLHEILPELADPRKHRNMPMRNSETTKVEKTPPPSNQKYRQISVKAAEDTCDDSPDSPPAVPFDVADVMHM